MSFRRAERLVTAFLCISGAAESCVLPFLCLHLTQLGVPPLQTGLALSALLMLRGLSGALWWRSLRSDRRPGRRRLAAAAGALVSAAVMCALAALPPSTGCGGDFGGVMVTGVSPLGLGHSPLEGVPVPGRGQQTHGAAVTAPPGGISGGHLLRPVGGGSGSQRPPPVGGGGHGHLQPPPVTAESSGLQPPTGETNLRPATTETSETSWHHRPEESETSLHQRPEESETNWYQRPEESGTSLHHRPEESETNEQIHRPTFTESPELHPVTVASSHEQPTTPDISDHIPPPPSPQRPLPGPVEPPTRPPAQPGAALVESETPEVTSGPVNAPPTAPSSAPLGVPPQQQRPTSNVNPAAPTDQEPAVPPGGGSHEIQPLVEAQGVQTVTGAGSEAGEGGVESSGEEEEEGSRLPIGITGALAQPGASQTTSSDSQNEPSGAQTAASGSHIQPSDSQTVVSDSQTVVSDSQTVVSDSQTVISGSQTGLGGSQTTDGSGDEMPQETEHHVSVSVPVAQPTAQLPAPSGPQTPKRGDRPAPVGGHQTADELDTYLSGSDETEVSRTTRSPLPSEPGEDDQEQPESNVNVESESSSSESESGRSESESEASGEDAESMDPGGVGHLNRDESLGFENPSAPPDPTSGRINSRPLAGSSSGHSREQERPGESDQHAPVSPPRSSSSAATSAETEDHRAGGRRPHHHHHHHASEDREDEDTVRESLHEDVESSHQDVDASRQKGSHYRPTTDVSNRGDSDRQPSDDRHSEGAGDGGRPCLDLSEIPWDPRKHPDPAGVTICDPSPPPGHPPVQTHRHSVQRHRAPPAPPPSVGDPSDPVPHRGQSGSPSGRVPGRGKLRAAGWSRVPQWPGDDQTPDHPHTLRSDQQPTTGQLMLRAGADSGGRARNYNSRARTTDGDADFRDVVLRPQDTLPLLPTPPRRLEQSSKESSAESEDREGVFERRGEGHLDERQRAGGERNSGPLREDTAVFSSGDLARSGNSRETDRNVLEGSGLNSRSHVDSELRRGEARPAIRPEASNANAGSRDRFETSPRRSEVRSRDGRPETWDAAEVGSRDAPKTVDPSGWSRRQRIESEDTQPERDRASSETGRDSSETGRASLEAGRASSEAGRDRDGEVTTPEITAVKYHHRLPNSQKSPDHAKYHTSRQRSGGRVQNYNYPVRPTDGSVSVASVDPTSGWSLTGALQGLEDLSPTLTRLLSGRKRRRETQRSPRRWESQHRRRRRRHKRSVIDAPAGPVSSDRDQIEEETPGARSWRNTYYSKDGGDSGKTDSELATAQAGYPEVSSSPRDQLSGSADSLRYHTSGDRAMYSPQSSSLPSESRLHIPRAARALPPSLPSRSNPSSLPDPSITSTPPSSLDPYLLFLLTLGLLSLWGTAGASHRRLVLHCWRRALDEAEHLERTERPRPAAEAASAVLLAAAAAVWPLLPGCLAGRQPLAALLVLGAALTLLAAILLPWMTLVGAKEPPQRTAAVLRSLVSCRSSLLFTVAVFVSGLMTSAEFNFLFVFAATWRPPPQAVLLLAAAAALASRLPVRALYRPLMVRCGFVGSVVLSFTALSARCLCYVCVPSAWGLLPAQLLVGLTETLFWRAAHVFVDKTAQDGHQQSTLSVLEALYAAGRCCGVVVAGAAFSAVGGVATFAGLATLSSAAALGYYVIARFSGDAPDLTYSKLPCDDRDDRDDRAETAALTGHWSRDHDDLDEVTDAPSTADQDWLERAMRQEGLL